jgi:hypothetical protein
VLAHDTTLARTSGKFMRQIRFSRAVLAVCSAAWLVTACSKKDATAVDGSGCDPTCGGSSATGGSGGTTGSGGSSAGGFSATGGFANGGLSGTGGVNASGGGISTGGAGGASGQNTGGASTGGTASSTGGDASTSIPTYTLVVDAPSDQSTVSNVSVVVRGRAPGFLNVEVWDATHQMPPLARVAPASDGTFSVTVDTSALADGATTWTVWGWDSPPNQAFNHTASVTLHLTIGAVVSNPPDAGSPPTGGTETIGTGDITKPAQGPAPTEASTVGGAAFTLVKNWDFGTSDTITDSATLISEFNFHDQFGTIANGTNYGAVTVAANSATAISAPNLGLPNDMQPVEDPAHPTREFTADSMKAYVRPLSTSQTTCTVSKHDAGNGSITAKWTLANGGTLLDKDLLWETRARMPVAAAAYWFAIWTAGNQWNKGAEMDVLESFGTPNIYPPPAAFHVDSVGGSDNIDYSSWPTGLTTAGVPTSDRDLTGYHTWTWLYKKDDSYVVYFDGYVVQTGSIHWTLGGGQGGTAIDMSFLFDFGWGHTQISDVNISLPASSFPITYEIDYSRVYLR